MSGNTGPICATCAHWAPGRFEPWYGQCHAQPAAIVSEGRRRWAPVNADEGCGAWQSLRVGPDAVHPTPAAWQRAEARAAIIAWMVQERAAEEGGEG